MPTRRKTDHREIHRRRRSGDGHARPAEQPSDAIQMLQDQHREIERLFDEIETARGEIARQVAFDELADALTYHTTMEEGVFYPTVNVDDTHPWLLHAVEEHLSAKRLIADLLELGPDDESWQAKVEVLREQIMMHVREEEELLFPRVRDMMDEDQLEAMAAEMIAVAADVPVETPRAQLLEECEIAAHLS